MEEGSVVDDAAYESPKTLLGENLVWVKESDAPIPVPSTRQEFLEGEVS